MKSPDTHRQSGTSRFQVISHSPEETFEFGRRIASFLEPGDFINLTGDLGAGKTTLTKGIAKGLGVQENITSPTFTIIKEYQGRLPFYHFDVYRLEETELDNLGYQEYFYADGITVVEWGSKIKGKLPKDYLSINIKYGNEEADRILEIIGHGTWTKKIINLKK